MFLLPLLPSYPQAEQSRAEQMEACTSTTTSRVVVLPLRAAPAPPPAAFFSRRSGGGGGRRRTRSVRLARASLLDRAAVLLDAGAAVGTGTGYSQASYYTSLGLFVLSVPGLWSLIKRSVKSKIVQKTLVKAEGQPMAPSLVAGEILSFFTRNSFTVSDRGEVITFEGTMTPSRGQAALLTFCTCISLGSVGLVLSIAVPQGGNNWFWLMTLSPLAGAYYWTRASRKEEIKVKMVLSEDGGDVSEVLVRGDDVQVEQMRKELNLSEKGMIYVKGIFET